MKFDQLPDYLKDDIKSKIAKKYINSDFKEFELVIVNILDSSIDLFSASKIERHMHININEVILTDIVLKTHIGIFQLFIIPREVNTKFLKFLDTHGIPYNYEYWMYIDVSFKIPTITNANPY